MTRVPLPGLLLLLVLAAAGCASSPDGEAQGVEGCWYFVQDDVAQELNLPWGVRLTDDVLTGWPAFDAESGARVAITLVGPDAMADNPFGYWQPLEGDSVRLGYPGMGGFAVRLAWAQDRLEGTARPVGDALMGERPRHPVALTRARCPEAIDGQ